jgi:hypothetical protein
MLRREIRRATTERRVTIFLTDILHEEFRLKAVP